MTIDGYQLKQCSDWYYLVPHMANSHDHVKKQNSMTLSREIIDEDLTRRESFPKQHRVFQKAHRRTVSCIAILSPQHHTIMSGDHTLHVSQPVSPSCSSQTRPSISHYSSMGSLPSKGEGFSGYDASQSNSATSLSTISGALDVRQCCPAGEGSTERFWLLMQVSEDLVKVLFHTRCVCVRVHACMRVCLRACMHACVHVCMCVCICVCMCVFTCVLSLYLSECCNFVKCSKSLKIRSIKNFKI